MAFIDSIHLYFATQVTETSQPQNHLANNYFAMLFFLWRCLRLISYVVPFSLVTFSYRGVLNYPDPQIMGGRSRLDSGQTKSFNMPRVRTLTPVCVNVVYDSCLIE